MGRHILDLYSGSQQTQNPSRCHTGKFSGVQDLSSVPSAVDISPRNTIGDPETEEKFACHDGDYKGDSDLAMKQHCAVNHQACLQGGGTPLQSCSTKQSDFAMQHKQRLSNHRHRCELAQEKSSELNTEGSDQAVQEIESLKNMLKSTEATFLRVNSTQDAAALNSVPFQPPREFPSRSPSRCLSYDHAAVERDGDSAVDRSSFHLTLPSTDVSTADVGSVTDSSSVSASASFGAELTNSVKSQVDKIKRSVANGKELLLTAPCDAESLLCPNCEYVTSNLTDIQLHCLRRHALEWQGKDLPLRQPDNVVVEKPVVVDEILACPKCKYVTSNLTDIQLHCIRRHNLEWRDLRQKQLKSSLQRNVTLQQFLSNPDTGCLFQSNEIS